MGGQDRSGDAEILGGNAGSGGLASVASNQANYFKIAAKSSAAGTLSHCFRNSPSFPKTKTRKSVEGASPLR